MAAVWHSLLGPLRCNFNTFFCFLGLRFDAAISEGRAAPLCGFQAESESDEALLVKYSTYTRNWDSVSCVYKGLKGKDIKM